MKAKKEEVEVVRKELRVEPCQGKIGYQVKFNGGGELPQELTGVFTSTREADIAISRYNSKRA